MYHTCTYNNFVDMIITKYVHSLANHVSYVYVY